MHNLYIFYADYCYCRLSESSKKNRKVVAYVNLQNSFLKQQSIDQMRSFIPAI